MTGFVHLHVHSEYSLLDGVAKVTELAEAARMEGMGAVALTDHGVMYGVVPFYQACLAAGVKPVIGCEFYLASDSIALKDRSGQSLYHITVLAMNEEGYRNLVRLNSVAHLEGFYYKPRIDFELLFQFHEGLIVLSGCIKGPVPQLLLQHKYEEASAMCERFLKVFGDRFYLEIMDHGLTEQRILRPQLISLSEELGIPLVVTNDVHYMKRADAEIQDLCLCIATGKTVQDQERLRIPGNELYFKSESEMLACFSDIPQAVFESGKIAARCQVNLERFRAEMPKFPLNSVSPAEKLYALCMEGVEIRYGKQIQLNHPVLYEAVIQRMNHELSVIGHMGYADYFLIVWDFMRYARERHIRTGPGRGSAAGSMVAYLLQITSVDPLSFGLIFERFLNPQRISMPDIDIDFPDDRRDEVIAYVRNRYGADRVAQIITFGTLAARAAVRDVGRALNLPYYEVDQVARLIPPQPGISLAEAIRQTEGLQSLIQQKPHLNKLIDMASRVEGMPRHASTHAAGIVIAPKPLNEWIPLQQGHQEVVMTQYPMEQLEWFGMLKMDFLGLRTLSTIERTVRSAKDQNRIQKALQHDSAMNDAITFQMLSRGDTSGVFQLESAGMRKVLKELKPESMNDLIAVLALYRPGPMEFIPKYISCKHGEMQAEYIHPVLEPVLKDTYGIIVYQEQIMRIASEMAGFSLAEADLLRRAISKKKREILDEQRKHFVNGCTVQGHDAVVSNKVYDLIVRFADYGFPRAHAAAYAVLAYQTAWLKAHEPLRFMASTLSSVMNQPKKMSEYMEDCRRNQIRLLPPDLNRSNYEFEADLESGCIRFGLLAIKQVGIHAAESLIHERTKQPFHDLQDLIRRVDPRVINKRVLEALIMSGAADGFGGNRAQQLAILDDLLEQAVKWRRDREFLQIDLFDFTEFHPQHIALPEVPAESLWSRMNWERELLGMALTGHPLDEFQERLEALSIPPLIRCRTMGDGEIVTLCGVVQNIQKIFTKKKEPMAFAMLSDRSDDLEVLFFPAAWKVAAGWLSNQMRIGIRGTIQHQEEKIQLIVNEIFDLEREKGWVEFTAKDEGKWKRKTSNHSRQLCAFIKVPSQSAHQLLVQLDQLFRKHRGNMPVCLMYEDTHGVAMLDEQVRIKPNGILTKEVERLLGNGSIRVKPISRQE